MVLSSAVVVIPGAAAIVLTIFPTIFPAIFPTVFAPILPAVFPAVLTTRRLIGFTRHRGCGQQRARDEKCTEQL
jgi:hypothetical protein